MSVSAFYRNFQAVTGMSPSSSRSRSGCRRPGCCSLATHPGDVTGVGHRVGYDNPSRFSREYRRQFGAPPRAFYLLPTWALSLR
ncbi:helix-turn-helix transcriptional regulator [Nonomuraea polychroma]|uniref:helix-turn-helix transcriptional regulator n=1 Tax=Nonomuraea polychroma TaxID=46176 RepID=UPI0019D46B7B|nr:helix-turn-helix transcriptional regulator [Nonomuraea polychroma]